MSDTKAQRLAILEGYCILDTPPEALYDKLVQHLATLCQAPVVLLAFFDAQRLWFKARVGIDLSEAPLATSACSQSLMQGETLMLADATQDPRFQGKPLIQGIEGMRFFAGLPLITREGLVLGSLCILDSRARELSDELSASLGLMAEHLLEILAQRRELKQARSEHARLETAINSSQAGVWEVYGPGQEASWLSPGLYRLLGYEPGELRMGPEDLFARIHPDDLAQAQDVMRLLGVSGDVLQSRLRLRTKQGIYRWFASSGQTLWDAHRQAHKRVGTVWDVDEQVQDQVAQQRLQEAIERLHRLSFELPVSERDFLNRGLELLCDYYQLPNAGIMRVQGEVYELLAIQAPYAITQGRVVEPGQKYQLADSLVGFVYERHGVSTLEDLESARPEAADFVKGFGIEAVIGSPYWIQGEARGVVTCYGHARRPDGFTPRDYEFMREFSHWLGFMQERYRHVSELHKLNTSKDRLLAVVAHDLRNPLASIMSAKWKLDKLLGEPEPSVGKMLSVIEMAYTRSIELIDELLDAAELEQDARNLPLEPLDLTELAHAVLHDFEGRASAQQLRLIWSAGTEPLIVGLNPAKMTRVLENLLSNALKFTPAGGEVQLQLSRAGNQARLSIQDTGIGIPESLQVHLFDKYSAARRQGLLGEQSNGLGMHIVKEIVDLHGGQIRVFSEAGQGTCFQLDLPLVLEITRTPEPDQQSQK